MQDNVHMRRHSTETFTKIVFLAVVLGVAGRSYGQKSTSHSPYSQFGIGQMREDLLPQARAMGGISAAVRHFNGIPTLNVGNPASYSAMNRTILEAGMYGNLTQLSKNGRNDHTGDFAFGHIAIGVPLNRINGPALGGLAFGLLPYSDIGYSTREVNSIERIVHEKKTLGEGGTNKAFVGYGVSPIKGLSIGANLGLIFGNLHDITNVNFLSEPDAYPTESRQTRNIRGATVDYGLQYSRALGRRLSLTVGYSGSLDNQITTKASRRVTIFEPRFEEDFQAPPLDTISFTDLGTRRVNLPLKHNIGLTLSKGYNWMVGADFKYADWSHFQVRSDENRLQKGYGIALGGQLRPDPTSVRYINQIDYRLGFRYSQTPVVFRNQRINDMAVTVGFGLPLPETNFGRTFSQLNLSAELGQQGTLSNNLVRERYINIHIGFTINDSWFLRRNLD